MRWVVGWSPLRTDDRSWQPWKAFGGPGLFDRLIADDYSRAGLEVLTLDRKMAKLDDVRRL